jgi:hypothetical protein
VNAPVGRREFFALEAGEYLERLALLAASPDQPDGENVVRYARALRGAALMAGPAGYAVAAGAIENVAKAVRGGSVAWTPILGEQLAETVEECKSMLRRLREWSDVDVQRCERLAERLDGLIGGAARRPGSSPGGPGLSAGVRAYVAREAAGVAAALEQVADVVEQRPAPDSADALLRRLQPLRGLGSMPGLSPLPELLEALDLTIALACRGGAWPRGAGRAFRATAAGLARMARDIAELGIPQHDSHEIVQAAELLREAFATEDDVVDVADLFLDGDTEGVVRRGVPPRTSTASSGVAMELAGLADRFRHAVGQMREGTSRTARGLALNALGLSVRGLALSREVSAAAGALLSRIDRETMSGRALVAGDRFVEILERAVAGLSAAAAAESAAMLGGALAPLSEELDRGAGVHQDASLEAALEIIPIESLAPDPEPDVVAIESLFYNAVTPAVTYYTPFEQSFVTLYQLERGALRPSTPIVSIESLAPAVEPAAVPIHSLLYRGRRALERADLVRRELDAALKRHRDLAAVEDLLDELLALVPLALDDDH